MARLPAGNAKNQALFEEDFVLRTLGRIGYDPETALAELVANAWDAAAEGVKVVIPETIDGLLTVEDDGHGMTPTEFRARWMTLNYDRSKVQGDQVQFPHDRVGMTRRAFGRNGVGRHGLLCFSDHYTVETWKNGVMSTFVIGTRDQPSPFYIKDESSVAKPGHGTRLMVVVDRHLPNPDTIRTVLSARFLHDPQFVVEVNGVSVPLSEHEGLVETRILTVADGLQVTAHVVDATNSARSTRYQGIAFWVNNRLVGMPSWYVGNTAVIDGRSRFAKRHAIVVQGGTAWQGEVEGDWSRLKNTEVVRALHAAVNDYAQEVFDKLSAESIEENSEDALMKNREAFRELPTGARFHVARFTQELVHDQPGIAPESLSMAVKAVIKLQQGRSGAGLLDKIMHLGEQDLAGLDRMLGEWSVQDALTVLDEIDERLSVIAAIEKLGGDENADELHTLHPLVTKARWLFGPEFDSSFYSSNHTLRTVAREIFKVKPADTRFFNPQKRPDLVAIPTSTLSIVGTETFDSNNENLCSIRDVLLIELKKGRSTIGMDEMFQASKYVQEFISNGGIVGTPFFNAFVVGHTLAKALVTSQELLDNDKRRLGRVTATTYAQLTDTANRRLHGLKDRIPSRYEDISGYELVQKVMGTESQAPLLQEEAYP